MNTNPTDQKTDPHWVPSIDERYKIIREHEWQIAFTIMSSITGQFDKKNDDDTITFVRENLKIIELASKLGRTSVHDDKLKDAEKFRAPEINAEFERCLKIVYSEKPKVTLPPNLRPQETTNDIPANN